MDGKDTDALMARIDRLESTVARLADLLERQGPGTPMPPGDLGVAGDAVEEAGAALARAGGSEETVRRLADSLVTVGEPETLEAITRIATMAPQLEYALHFVAAGPELLEDVLEIVREEMDEDDPAAAQRRVDAAREALVALSATPVLHTVTGLGRTLPAIEPALNGTAHGLTQLAAVEGDDALASRVSSAVIRLAEPETLESLLNLAELAPDLEYAARFAAAGPVLLEEGLEMVQGMTADGPPMQARVDAGIEAAQALSEPAVLAALTQVAAAAPQLAHLASLVGDPERLTALETLLDLGVHAAQPGHAEALSKLVEHAPQVVDALVVLPDQPETLDFLQSANLAVAEGLHDGHERLGAWGLFRALQDPNVQLAAGFTVHVARHLGMHLGTGGVPAKAK